MKIILTDDLINNNMNKIYLSGQISGLPYKEVKAKFETAATKLIAEGYEVVNPINNGIPINAPWELHIAMDVVLLMGCDSIYLLPDWQQSKGAILEKSFAELTGKKMIYEEVPAFPLIKQAIAEIMGVTFPEITGRNRARKYVYARMIFAHLCREQGATIVTIARDMQHHHATVIYYLKKYQDDYKYTPEFRGYVEAVQNAIVRYSEERKGLLFSNLEEDPLYIRAIQKLEEKKQKVIEAEATVTELIKKNHSINQ